MTSTLTFSEDNINSTVANNLDKTIIYTMETIECWKDINGFEGYQVSNLGNVKRLKRMFCSKLGNLFEMPDKILTGHINNTGYRSVKINKQIIRVHQLVAIAFLGHKRCRYKIVVDHIDNNKLNNCLENLRLLTSRENTIRGRLTKSSKYLGVSWKKSKGKWIVCIKKDSKHIHIGLFINEEEASLTYQKAFNNLHKYNGNNLDFRKIILNN